MTKKITGLEFPVTIYGTIEKYNDTLSKARCRIFYKGGNRNGTYITEEFAQQLITTLPYTPIKGIYDMNEQDYTDHGEERSLGRIYGIVPEHNNFAWESHLDSDGAIREYACTDILLFTALYEECNEIIGKSQSMELYPPSITGEWQIIDGRRYYTFKTGHFLGLQVLGDAVEPCFEGAAFFSLMERLETALAQIEKYNFTINDSEQGGTIMPTISFKLSDNEKFSLLWSLLNPNYNEENDWTVENMISEVYDEYALTFNLNENCYYRVYYTKNEDAVELGNVVKCYIIDVTESEKNALESLHKLTGTYELVDEIYTNAKANEEKITEYEQKIEENEASISTLTLENEELNSTLNSFKEQNESLQSYKMAKEQEEKLNVINKYAKQLSEDTLNKFKESLNNYSLDSLEKDLAYEFVQSKPSIFEKTSTFDKVVPIECPTSGLEEILSKYRK